MIVFLQSPSSTAASVKQCGCVCPRLPVRQQNSVLTWKFLQVQRNKSKILWLYDCVVVSVTGHANYSFFAPYWIPWCAVCLALLYFGSGGGEGDVLDMEFVFWFTGKPFEIFLISGWIKRHIALNILKPQCKVPDTFVRFLPNFKFLRSPQYKIPRKSNKREPRCCLLTDGQTLRRWESLSATLRTHKKTGDDYETEGRTVWWGYCVEAVMKMEAASSHKICFCTYVLSSWFCYQLVRFKIIS